VRTRLVFACRSTVALPRTMRNSCIVHLLLVVVTRSRTEICRGWGAGLFSPGRRAGLVHLATLSAILRSPLLGEPPTPTQSVVLCHMQMRLRRNPRIFTSISVVRLWKICSSRNDDRSTQLEFKKDTSRKKNLSTSKGRVIAVLPPFSFTARLD
jgi:hypothetical protein